MAPPPLFAPTEDAAERFHAFFPVHLRNAQSRRAYARIAHRFADWAQTQGLTRLEEVRPIHIAAYLDALPLAKASVNLHLAALRSLLDWLVLGQILAVNPAHPVRGPKHVVRHGSTPVLALEEARALLDSIEEGSLIGLRDRALILLMLATFARIGAVLQMNVSDYFIQGRRRWVRLHEKGGKEYAAPLHRTAGSGS